MFTCEVTKTKEVVKVLQKLNNIKHETVVHGRIHAGLQFCKQHQHWDTSMVVH